MYAAKKWLVEIIITEHDGQTRARAQLHDRDDSGLVGLGIAELNPVDADVPEIGDELAVARALTDLAHKLRADAVTDIAGVTHKPAHLTP